MIKSALEARALVDKWNEKSDISFILTKIEEEAINGITHISFQETFTTKQLQELMRIGFKIENPPGSFIISW